MERSSVTSARAPRSIAGARCGPRPYCRQSAADVAIAVRARPARRDRPTQALSGTLVSEGLACARADAQRAGGPDRGG